MACVPCLGFLAVRLALWFIDNKLKYTTLLQSAYHNFAHAVHCNFAEYACLQLQSAHYTL